MKPWQKFFLLECLLAVMFATWFTRWYKREPTEPSLTPGAVPSSQPETDRLLAKTPSPVSTPTQSPVPTVIPPPQFNQEQIQEFLVRFALQYGVDVNVLRHLAICESGLIANSTNGVYVGLFQFGPGAWKTSRSAMGEDANLGLRYNAEEATQTAAYAISVGKSYLWPNCYPG